jgi:hypothetical protein
VEPQQSHSWIEQHFKKSNLRLFPAAFAWRFLFLKKLSTMHTDLVSEFFKKILWKADHTPSLE